MTTIMIKSRAGEIEGKRNQEIAYFDKFDKRADKIIRHFILFQYGVMLRFEPFGWKNEWYIDFIEILIIFFPNLFFLFFSSKVRK